MKLAKFLFSFEGELDRRAYALASLSAFFTQHAFVLVCMWQSGRYDDLRSIGFLFNPMRYLTRATIETTFLGLLLMLIVAWILVALSFRRARKDRADLVLVVPIVMPALQLPMIALLSLLMPTGTKVRHAEPAPRHTGAITIPAMQGALAGMTISLTACAFGTLVMQSYGYTLFFATPLVVGVTAAYVANRRADIGLAKTNKVVLAALGLGAAAIMGVAIEGAICLIMASPLIVGIGYVGGVIGYVAAKSRSGGRTTLSGIAALPLLFMLEAAFPPRGDFVSLESIDVAAGPDEVWRSITHMGSIDVPPSAPFGWGLAYPVSGEIDGEGVGAVRRGVFSTGVAYERVTEWEPGRKLWFDVLSDPPALKELSPYDQVQAPHLAGYFTTAYARFSITPLGDGRTRLSLETLHTLDLDPALYWTPIAQWAVHENKKRVLAHFASQAEDWAASGGRRPVK
ncbi:MAG: hypothetical protein QM773_18585 [Hyphomonadaceae bacterium]